MRSTVGGACSAAPLSFAAVPVLCAVPGAVRGTPHRTAHAKPLMAPRLAIMRPVPSADIRS
ncbi:hypothetical protein OG727_03680 [Streptomyces caniferus]|uniref:Uncharacterized protein n=1 Tax=Streptomyces caniferus TaxID=285557 RepID=A0ABZ1VE02_9ACTN|nr:hypothetical protein [Streptomyces caniferus]